MKNFDVVTTGAKSKAAIRLFEKNCNPIRGEKENLYTLDYELTLFRIVLKCCGM